MGLALRFIKSIDGNYLNRIRYYSIKDLPNRPHEAQIVEMPGIESTTSWLVKLADDSIERLIKYMSLQHSFGDILLNALSCMNILDSSCFV